MTAIDAQPGHSTAETTVFHLSPLSRRDEVYERLVSRGWEFNFFQAVWLLERYRGGSAIDGYPAHIKPALVGERGPVRCEPLRFRPHISMGFPPTDVRRIEVLSNPDNNGHYFR